MPRRQYKKRHTEPDSVYNSREVARLINYIMRDGKKTVAESIVYDAFRRIEQEKKDPIEILRQAIDNVAPSHEVRPKRVGGASYLVPSETRPDRKIFLAFNWIINAALSRPNKEFKTMAEKIYAELMEAYKDQGEAVNKKKQVEKLAEANKAFAHFRW